MRGSCRFVQLKGVVIDTLDICVDLVRWDLV